MNKGRQLSYTKVTCQNALGREEVLRQTREVPHLPVSPGKGHMYSKAGSPNLPPGERKRSAFLQQCAKLDAKQFRRGSGLFHCTGVKPVELSQLLNTVWIHIVGVFTHSLAGLLEQDPKTRHLKLLASVLTSSVSLSRPSPSRSRACNRGSK